MFNKHLLKIYFNCNDCVFLPRRYFFYLCLWRVYIFFNIRKRINIILTNKDYMLFLNSKFRYKFEFTDILSFSYLSYKFKKILELPLGDIYIAPQMVFKKSKFNKINYFYYFCCVLIHGVLHVLGFTHNSMSTFKKMEFLQEFFLSKIYLNYVYL